MFKILVLSCMLVVSSICPNISEDEFILSLNRRQKQWVAGKNNLNKVPKHICVEESDVYPTTKKITTHRRAIPRQFDSRTKWPYCKDIFNSIPDQGRCANCWATSIAAGFADRLCIATKGTSIQTSAEDLTTCCRQCSMQRNGCLGGSMTTACDFLKNQGVVSGGHYGSYEGCKPYTERLYMYKTNNPEMKPLPCESRCSNNYQISYKKDRKRIIGWRMLPRDVPTIQRNIMAYGPIVAVYKFYQDFKYYQSGVYSSPFRPEHEFKHAINIIGWGTENNLDYWLVRNSWGNDWGNLGGFFKILRKRDNGGIEKEVYALYIRSGGRAIKNETFIASSYSLILPNFVIVVADFILVMVVK